jgi:ferric-dicitrate binding protein FerR (iron transport regulator)
MYCFSILFMSKDQNHNQDHLVQLLIRYIQGKLTESEQRRLDTWLSQDPKNKELFEDLKDADSRNTAIEKMNAYREDAVFQKLHSQLGFATTKTRKRLSGAWIAAASVLLIALGGLLAYFSLSYKSGQKVAVSKVGMRPQDIAPGGNKAMLTLANGQTIILDSVNAGQLASQGNSTIMKVNSGLLAYKASPAKPKEIHYNVLSTPRGGQYALLLPDGSKVWLNAATSIRFPTEFSEKTRLVEILYGEAYFEVKTDQKRPFTVKNGEAEITVLGTHFNVNAYKEEPSVKVTLLEGAVRVSQLTTHHTQIVRKGQQAKIDKAGDIQLVEHPDLGLETAWKEGRFEFNGGIQGIMRQIARWYDVDVVYEGDVTGKAYGGVISRYEQVSKVLKMLELTGSIHFKIDEKHATGRAGTIIVSP